MAIRLFEGASHAASYAAFRPTYPPSVIQTISKFIKDQSGSGFGSAVDVGCGSGQSTFFLASLFDKVLGVDISEAQIQNARAKKEQNDEVLQKKVEFRVAAADSLPLETSSVDLVSCAQAWHWLDPPSLYREAARVLRPRGTLAVYGYGNPEVASNPEAHEHVSEFYWNLRRGGYWHENRRHIDNKYEELELSDQQFHISERHELTMNRRMSLSHFTGYVSTWSGYCNFAERHPHSTILRDLQQKLSETLATSEEENPYVDISFPVFIVIGQMS